jgi:hypothetical protein
MSTIRNVAELKAAISLLEEKQEYEGLLLKEQFNITYESLKPANFIRSTISKLFLAPDMKEGFFNTSLSLLVGFFSKKIAIGSSKNPFKQIIGNLLQRGVASAVSRNAEGIRAKFVNMLEFIFDKKAK